MKGEWERTEDGCLETRGEKRREDSQRKVKEKKD